MNHNNGSRLRVVGQIGTPQNGHAKLKAPAKAKEATPKAPKGKGSGRGRRRRTKLKRLNSVSKAPGLDPIPGGAEPAEEPDARHDVHRAPPLPGLGGLGVLAGTGGGHGHPRLRRGSRSNSSSSLRRGESSSSITYLVNGAGADEGSGSRRGSLTRTHSRELLIAAAGAVDAHKVAFAQEVARQEHMLNVERERYSAVRGQDECSSTIWRLAREYKADLVPKHGGLTSAERRWLVHLGTCRSPARRGAARHRTAPPACLGGWPVCHMYACVCVCVVDMWTGGHVDTWIYVCVCARARARA